jgi:hypothetical protein
MTTAHTISVSARQLDLLKGMLETALSSREDDARDGFVYMDDVRDDFQYMDGDPVGEYGDPFYDEHEESRAAAHSFKDCCQLYYRLFHEDWAGHKGTYTREGKWLGQELPFWA